MFIACNAMPTVSISISDDPSTLLQERAHRDEPAEPFLLVYLVMDGMRVFRASCPVLLHARLQAALAFLTDVSWTLIFDIVSCSKQ